MRMLTEPTAILQRFFAGVANDLRKRGAAPSEKTTAPNYCAGSTRSNPNGVQNYRSKQNFVWCEAFHIGF